MNRSLRLTSRAAILASACLLTLTASGATASARMRPTAAHPPLAAAKAAKVTAAARSALGTPYLLGSPWPACRVGVRKPAFFNSGTLVRWTYCHALGVNLPGYTPALATDRHLVTVTRPAVSDILLCNAHGRPGPDYAVAGIVTPDRHVIYAGSRVKSTTYAQFTSWCGPTLIRRLR